MKKIKVQIPAGIQNNEKIRMVGLGKEGKNGGKNGAYKAALKKTDKVVLKAINGFDLEENLPWDFIDIGVTKKHLIREWEKAQRGEVTLNCREKCAGCGANKYGSGTFCH